MIDISNKIAFEIGKIKNDNYVIMIEKSHFMIMLNYSIFDITFINDWHVVTDINMLYFIRMNHIKGKMLIETK